MDKPATITTNGGTNAVADVQLDAANIFRSQTAFTLAVRMADAFSKSTIVPKDYQNNPANCLIALEMANRIGTAPLMVMQNLYIVNGRPAWSSQFIVAMINNSKKYKTELQYDLTGKGDDLACYAFVIDQNGRKIAGPTIDMKMAKAEGWLDKNGSKWKTMPEVMIRYRAASFFGRLNCPDMIMGIYSADEVIDLPENQYRYVEASKNEPAQTGVAYDYPQQNDYTKPSGDLEPGEIEPDASPSEYGTDEPDYQPDEHVPEPNAATTAANTATSGEYACADCNKKITQQENDFSVRLYKRPLCRPHQKDAKQAQSAAMNGGGLS